MTDLKAMSRKQGFIGRTRTGLHVWVDIELRLRHHEGFTVEHEPIGAYLELSITGATKSRGVGQIVNTLRQVTRPADGWMLADVRALVEVWGRWHLNGMKAGCAHMPVIAGYHGGAWTPCPKQAADPKIETPYLYGSAWLVDTLPAEIVKQVRRWGQKLDGDFPDDY